MNWIKFRKFMILLERLHLKYFQRLESKYIHCELCLLTYYCRHNSAHMNLTFPPKEPAGISKLLPHASEQCTDLITKLLAYSPDERFVVLTSFL